MENDNINMDMDIRTTIAALRNIEDSDEYRHSNPTALRRKATLDEQISKWVWE